MPTTCSYNLTFAMQSDRGKKRRQNEDSFLALPEENFFCVCDGMGGLQYGKESSHIATQLMQSLILSHTEDDEPQNTPQQIVKAHEKILFYAIQYVSKHLYDFGNYNDEFYYGTTFTGVWLFKNQALFGNLGDSRCYLLKHDSKQFQQVTKDHSLVQMLLDTNQITAKQAEHFPHQNEILQFMGMNPFDCSPDIFTKTIHSGDKILICSDGLTKMVSDKDIPAILSIDSWDTQKKCQQLIKLANQNGGRDNITAILLEIGQSLEPISEPSL